MKILIVTQYFPPEIGAAATRWSEYSKILQNNGHDVTILTELPNYPSGIIAEGYPKYWFHEDTQIKNLPRVIRVPIWANPRRTTIQRLGFYVSFMMNATLRALFLPRYDYIVVSSPPLFVGLIATLIRPFKRAKYVLDLRDIWPESAIVLGEINSKIMSSIGKYVERLVYKSVDSFFLAVPGFVQYLETYHSSHLRKKKINLMNGVSESFLELINSERNIPKAKKFTVLFSGNIGLAQGLETIIEVARLLAQEDVLFKIIGDGSKRDEIVSQLKILGLSNVSIFPSMSRNQLVREILTSHICLVPLIKSPLFLNAIPSKMLEYMAAGKPVIVSIMGEVETIIKNAECGQIVEPENSADMVESIMGYLRNPDRLIFEGKKGIQFVKHNFLKEDLIFDAFEELERE